MKILVVEDESTSMELLVSFLLPYGKIDRAYDGKEAMGAIKKAFTDGAPYNLICLDIMMPEMDGHEVLEKMRTEESRKGVLLGDGAKVIMITCKSDSKNILGSFNKQCDGYIVKPVEKRMLEEELKRLGFHKS